MPDLITGHVWRSNVNRVHSWPERDACWYMNCRRLRAEHERSVSGQPGGRRAR